jgi:GMP synthase-like glutamine amidotransferase
MSPPKILVLDCTPRRTAASWFNLALQKCGAYQLFKATPEDNHPALESAQALLVSGSPRDAFAEDEWTHRALEFCAKGIALGLPVLGICYGHQLLGRLYGAKVGRNPKGWEVGETLIQSTGEISPLDFPGQLPVLESHQDCVLDLPAGSRALATNDHTRLQAVQWGPHVYGVQFHPEFTGDILRDVWKTRRDQWRGRVPFDLDGKLDNAGDGKLGLEILRRFLEIQR